MSSSIQAQKGRAFLLQLGTGVSPEVYTTVAGLRATDMTINGNPVDITNKGSAGWQEMFAGAGVRSCDITGSGIFDANTAAPMTTMQNAALAGGTILNMRVITDRGDQFVGEWAVATFKRTGNHDNAETFDVTLKSHGPVTLIAAA